VSLKIEQPEVIYQYLDSPVVGRIQAFLGRVRAGVHIDYRTKIWGERSRSEVLETLLSLAIPSGHDNFDELEREASEKFGSFSMREPFDLVRSRLEEYFQPKTFSFSDDTLNRAILEVRRLLPRGSLRATDLDTAYENSPKGTNWGLPFFSSDDVDYPRYLDLARDLMRRRFPIGDYYPCILGVRSQPNGIGEYAKWRPLHMASHVATIHELRLLRPMLNQLKLNDMFTAWRTPEDINRVITQKMRKRIGRRWLSTDFRSYDATLPPQIIEGVYDCMRYWFTDDALDLINWAEDLMLHVGVITPEGLWLGRDGGVASGLTMTNMVDTLGQYTVDLMVAEYLNTTLIEALYLGDDGAKLYYDDIDPEKYAEGASLAGLTANADKTLYSEEEIDFLQRRHSLRYEVNGIYPGYRSMVRTGDGVISAETFPDFSGYVLSLRGIQQVEQTKDDPHFKKLVSWLYRGDKFLRTWSASTLLERAGGVGGAEKALKIRSYPYNQPNLRRLLQFETVKQIEFENRMRSGLRAPR
jgi:hypothetical protein